MEFILVSDLHGSISRYRKLFQLIRDRKPPAVLFGGDLLPSPSHQRKLITEGIGDFIAEFLAPELGSLQQQMGNEYPRMLMILGNDDAKSEEKRFVMAGSNGLYEYLHFRKTQVGPYTVYGYSCVPPTPFLLKDWERYDVSRFTDPGCIPPEEGRFSIEPAHDILFTYIKKDLVELTGEHFKPESSIMLFHSPPYQTFLDRAALDGKMFDHVPMDVHVGSIAIKEFIETRQPLVSLHGHIHESSRITGHWKQELGKTWCFSAAFDQPELAAVIFNPEKLSSAERLII
jgi:uncharacterized protein